MSNPSPLPVGKLPPDLLGRLLESARGHPRLLVGPRVGEDAAVIDVGDRCLVAKSDPITFVEDGIGRYAVHVNANDVACMGAVPMWFLMTLLLPEGRTDEAMVGRVWRDAEAACAELGVTLCGGHAEITAGLEFPVLSGHMLGEVARERLVRGADARAGDAILLTRAVPVEGTAILANAKYDFLKGVIAPEVLERAKGYLDSPGISVVPQALAAAATGLARAMHDPTEGGLATGARELAEAAGLGAALEESAIPISREGGLICEALGLDPLGVITSGALLLAAPPEAEEPLREAIGETGATCVRIGRLCPPGLGVTMESGGKSRPLRRFQTDEVSRAIRGGE